MPAGNQYGAVCMYTDLCSGLVLISAGKPRKTNSYDITVRCPEFAASCPQLPVNGAAKGSWAVDKKISKEINLNFSGSISWWQTCILCLRCLNNLVLSVSRRPLLFVVLVCKTPPQASTPFELEPAQTQTRSACPFTPLLAPSSPPPCDLWNRFIFPLSLELVVFVPSSPSSERLQVRVLERTFLPSWTT